MLNSCLCTEERLLSAPMLAWAKRLKEAPGHLHRKVWEWCFISLALEERGMLQRGRRGLGFAVGQEPLAAAFVHRGARITATDLYEEEAAAKGWVETGQHAGGYAAITLRKLCDPQKLERLLEFRFADMTNFGAQFDGQYDFVWSSCALEHLGDLEAGLRFIERAMACLKPGGFAVHTTEFNVSSNTDTVESGATVLYRRRDIEGLLARLAAQGHRIAIDWNEGSGHGDKIIDLPPYKHDIHLKIAIDRYVVTSIGIIIQKAGRLRSLQLAVLAKLRSWRQAAQPGFQTP